MYSKSLTWEDSDKYIIIHHHDEHRNESGEMVDLIQIRKSGTMLDLLGSTPRNRSTGSSPKRAYRRSGLSNVMLPLESFPEWFAWFKDREVYNEYELEVLVDDPEVVSVLSSMEI